jgi:hypothetical protein
MKARSDAPRDTQVPLDEELEQALQQVKDEYGLADLDQAAELAVKRRLRRSAKALTGRGRALYPVGPGDR